MKNGGKQLFTIHTVPTYVEDFYTILKVKLALIMIMNGWSLNVHFVFHNFAFNQEAFNPGYCDDKGVFRPG